MNTICMKLTFGIEARANRKLMMSVNTSEKKFKVKNILIRKSLFSFIHSLRVDFGRQSVVRRHRKSSIRSAESESENMKTQPRRENLFDGEKKSHTS